LNNREGLEACIDLILRAAEDLDVPLTKGVSFGFSTTRLSSASSMAQGMDPFLRFSVGWDIMRIEDLAGIIVQGIYEYLAIFDPENEPLKQNGALSHNGAPCQNGVLDGTH